MKSARHVMVSSIVMLSVNKVIRNFIRKQFVISFWNYKPNKLKKNN